jgi:Chaperone of endosialidase
MKIIHNVIGASCLALTFGAVSLHAQNVGIGVPNPVSKLSVNGTTASGGLAIGDSTYTSTAGTIAPANGALIEGNVGIGLTTPQVPLHVDGEVYVSPGGITGQFWNGTANIDGIQFDPSGFIGAQRASGSPLHLSKPTTYSNDELIIFSINNSAIGDVTTDGTSVSYNTTSDIRLKENVRPTAEGLNEVMRIQVSDFNFKSTPGRNETGFIAQQLYTVVPEAVHQGGTNPATDPWTADYGRVTPLLTRAIQEQQSEIEALKEQAKNQDAAFKTENATLRAENAKLETLEAANATLRSEVAQLKAANEKFSVLATQMQELKKDVTSAQEKEKGEVRNVSLEQ